MGCSVLQVSPCVGRVMQCVAGYCSWLQCDAVCYCVLQCVAVCCSWLQYVEIGARQYMQVENLISRYVGRDSFICSYHMRYVSRTSESCHTH